MFSYTTLYFTCPFFSITGVSTSLYSLWLARFMMFIVSVDVLFVISLLPILLVPFSPITSDITNVAVYCCPFALSLSIFTSNVIGSIDSPEVQPYIYHVNFCVPSSLSIISGSPYSELPNLS